MSGTSKADKIFNAGKYATISAEAGNDYIYNNFGDDVSINSGDGNDSIYNVGDYVIIDAGAGNDSIYDYSEDASINAGTGNDSIVSEFSYGTTINAGKGDDSIDIYEAWNIVVEYATGDGNDTIVGFDENDTLHITSGTYSTTKSGNDVIVKVGSGSIRLKNVSSDMPIAVRDANGQTRVINYDIYNYASTTTVSGTSKADKIFNAGDDVTISAEAGNELLRL